NERQEIEMTGQHRRSAPIQTEPGDEQRPVEGADVVGGGPAGGGEKGGPGSEQELDLAERIPVPPAEADEEGQGAGPRRQPGGLGVEADQGNLGAGMIRQAGASIAVDRQRDRSRLDPGMAPTDAA